MATEQSDEVRKESTIIVIIAMPALPHLLLLVSSPPHRKQGLGVMVARDALVYGAHEKPAEKHQSLRQGKGIVVVALEADGVPDG